MPDWLADVLGDVTLLQAVLWALAVIAFVAGVVKLWPVVRKAVKLIDSLAELPEFMSTTRQQLADIHHETHTNNGSSIKDAMKRVEEGVAGLYEKVDDLAAEDKRLQTQIDESTQPHPRSGVPNPRRKK